VLRITTPHRRSTLNTVDLLNPTLAPTASINSPVWQERAPIG